MDYVIVAGDERFEYLARLLRRRGRAAVRVTGADGGARMAEALREAKRVVVNAPVKNDGLRRALLGAAGRGARIYACGPGHPACAENVADLWTDEELLTRNAELTAEGAMAAAMRASDRALRDMDCLVVGWGRIGRSLTEMLVAHGARVLVASRKQASRNRAVERGAEGVATEEIAKALPGRGLVFNTAPSPVLGAEALARADGDAMLIDLASPPYGIDLKAAWDRGLRAWREPGLPGRYCPGSAARALLEAMDRSDRGGVRHD